MKALKMGITQQCKKYDLPQQCVSIGYVPAMFSGRVYHNNVLMLGIAQQSNKAACISAK